MNRKGNAKDEEEKDERWKGRKQRELNKGRARDKQEGKDER